MSKQPFLVRRARPEDDAQVGEILVSGYQTRYAQKMPHVRLGPERIATLRDVATKRAEACVLVLELEGRVAGTVALWPAGSPGSEAFVPGAADLRHLAVDPAVQGQGLAKPLLDEAERIARDEWHVPALCLHVRRGNLGVARLYAARGYVRHPAGDLEYPEVSLEAYVLHFPELA